MSTAYLQIIFILAGNAASCFITMYLVRWRKREAWPEKFEKEIQDLARQIVVLRGQIKYIEGRMNGKGWLKEN